MIGKELIFELFNRHRLSLSIRSAVAFFAFGLFVLFCSCLTCAVTALHCCVTSINYGNSSARNADLSFDHSEQLSDSISNWDYKARTDLCSCCCRFCCKGSFIILSLLFFAFFDFKGISKWLLKVQQFRYHFAIIILEKLRRLKQIG